MSASSQFFESTTTAIGLGDATIMKPEALDAFATQSIRPGAMEAATAEPPEDHQRSTETNTAEQKDVSRLICYSCCYLLLTYVVSSA
jgi:hypothetical protein